MTEKKEAPAAQKKLSPDWFVRGILAKIGDTFDKLTGRDWKPTSTLATSGLIERMKKLLDAEVREADGKGRFVPHNIKLKMQWDKFSTDAEEDLKKLEYELLAAAIDHINDNRYHTYAPLKFEIKHDYFTEGVKLQASFDEFAPDGDEQPEVEMKVSLPQIKVGEFIPPPPAEETKEETVDFIVEFEANNKPQTVELKFKKGERQSVGRTKENNITIDDASISKHHATLKVDAEGSLLVADTGSTNGTFINNERIAYGRAFAVGEVDKLKFGSVEVYFRRIPKPTDFVTEELAATEGYEETRAFDANIQPPAVRGEEEAIQPRDRATERLQTAKREVTIPPSATAAATVRLSEKMPVERETFKTNQNERRATAPDIREDSADFSRETSENGAAAHTEPGIKFDFEGDDR